MRAQSFVSWAIGTAGLGDTATQLPGRPLCRMSPLSSSLLQCRPPWSAGDCGGHRRCFPSPGRVRLCSSERGCAQGLLHGSFVLISWQVLSNSRARPCSISKFPPHNLEGGMERELSYYSQLRSTGVLMDMHLECHSSAHTACSTAGTQGRDTQQEQRLSQGTQHCFWTQKAHAAR